MDMNDFFNYKLMKYVHEGEVEDCEGKDLIYNLGRYVPHAKLSEDELFTIKCMMEAKPDIAVLYEKDDKQYLLFLECKFEYGESSYSNKDKSNRKKQSEIQWMIADFLCRTYLEGKTEVSESMRDKKVPVWSGLYVRMERKQRKKLRLAIWLILMGKKSFMKRKPLSKTAASYFCRCTFNGSVTMASQKEVRTYDRFKQMDLFSGHCRMAVRRTPVRPFATDKLHPFSTSQNVGR